MAEARPRGEDMGSTRILVVLDVDGAVSPLQHHDVASEPNFATPVAEQVLAALQTLTAPADVHVGWVTSWSPKMIRWLIEERLDGRLDGPHLHDNDDWAPGWRARAVTRVVASTGARAVVWFDDMAVPATLTRTLGRARLNPAVLVIRPDKYTGITLQQASRAVRFVDGFRNSASTTDADER